MSKSPRLFHLMSLAQHRLLKATDSAFGETLGISTSQLGVLFALESNPGGMPSEVAEILGINKSAMTALMDRMEASGLLRREFSNEDGRAFRLFASPGGLAKAVAARPILTRLNARLTSGFDEQELGTIARFLSSILEHF